MIWHQNIIELAPLPRGFNLVTNEILVQAPELTNCEVGLLHLFIQHTSASLAINENATGRAWRSGASLQCDGAGARRLLRAHPGRPG